MSDPLTDGLRELIRSVVRDELATVTRTAPTVQLWSVEEFTRQAGIGRSLAYELIARGRLRSVRIGRRRLVPSDALAELVAS
jgi:excisionase family DNA binding protein